ncbi:MAG: thermosome subunit beta, partial [Halobacteriaceae archaeon]
MAQQMQGGIPMIVMGDDAQRVQDRDAQQYNIQAARAVAESVRSTLGPKGMDKMLVNDFGDVTITNDGVTILDEMEIDNPTAEMIVEVAETQEDEAGDGTTTAVAIAGELLKNAEDLLDQDIHPTAIIRGFNEAAERARDEIDDISRDVDPDDADLLRKVAETSMTGKGAEIDKEMLAELVVEAVRQIAVEEEDGSVTVNTKKIDIHTQRGRSVDESEVIRGAVVDKEPAHDDMPTDIEDARILLVNDSLEVGEADVDIDVSIESPDQLQSFIDKEDEELREMAEKIKSTGANVVFCQKGVDQPLQHYLAREGILCARRVLKGDMGMLSDVLGVDIVEDIDRATAEDVGHGSVEQDYSGDIEDDYLFYVRSDDEGAEAVTLLLRGSTNHVVDELERGVEDALDVVAHTLSDGRVLPGGGAIEVELADRLRDYADSVSGREQLAVEAFADSLELVPRVLAGNAGLDAIDTLVDLRSAHEEGQESAGLDVETGEVSDSYEAGVVEPAHAKAQAVSSAAEAANLVLKIDDIISAGD